MRVPWLFSYRDGMPVFAVVLAATLMLLVSPTVAFAGWSVPRSFGVSRYAITAVAVDSRGDAAVAWATQDGPSSPPSFRTSVHVTVRTARGRLSTRTVWSSHDARTDGLSVVLGAGEVTVAWGSVNRARGPTVRATYGPLIGRWRPPRAIGRISQTADTPPTPWYPHLAVAPHGEALLAWNYWNGSFANTGGVAVAWRAPGRSFGSPQVLPNAPAGAVPQFDSRGTAYLYGYCNPLVLIASAHTRRFGRTVVLVHGPVLAFTLSLAGAGHGLAAWVAGECSLNVALLPNFPGPVFASVLRAGTFAKPLEITPANVTAYASNAVAVGGGGTVTWATNGVDEIFSLHIGADGLPGATRQVTGGLIALTADGGGDEVFAWPPYWSPGIPPSAPFVRPAGGGADQPAPGYKGNVAVAAPAGRAVASAWNTSPTGSGPIMALSVWRP